MPPGANGTTHLIGFVGHACASAIDRQGEQQQQGQATLHDSSCSGWMHDARHDTPDDTPGADRRHRVHRRLHAAEAVT